MLRLSSIPKERAPAEVADEIVALESADLTSRLADHVIAISIGFRYSPYDFDVTAMMPLRFARGRVPGGIVLGSLVNWAIYTLGLELRGRSRPGRRRPTVPPRDLVDRVPVFGWLRLSREATIHGRGFWLRPLLLELGDRRGAGGAVLVGNRAAGTDLAGQVVARLSLLAAARGPLHWQFVSHVLLLCLMLAASFIDIDEKIIPDEITVPGTMLGLVLATLRADVAVAARGRARQRHRSWAS